ncbi:MAG: recombination protein RecR [Clostridia bacterium]|nr:recombination protein RecR [Clostridia bacterium]
MSLPDSLQNLIKRFARLPGVGNKTAQRYAFSVLAMSDEDTSALASAILQVKADIHMCPVCGAYTDNDSLCDMCTDEKRSDDIICVVESARDVFYMDSTQNGFSGKFHVLGGVLSPIDGITPDKLNISSLVQRVKDSHVKEVIIATEPDVEGEATAGYIAGLLKPQGVKVTRIAYGMPIGSNMEFVDSMTLTLALEGRREI